jgi:hypothetical protein
MTELKESVTPEAKPPRRAAPARRRPSRCKKTPWLPCTLEDGHEGGCAYEPARKVH